MTIPIISKLRERGLPEAVANYPMLLFMAAALIVAVVLLSLAGTLIEKREDVLVEVCGFFLDIVLFGVVLSIYDKWRNRKTKIRQYHELLDDIAHVKSEEGVAQKVGVIRRLNRMSARLPSLKFTALSGARMHEVSLEGADLFHADLSSSMLRFADLVGANLEDANLHNVSGQLANFRLANLTNANLEGARLDGADLIGANLSYAKCVNTHLFKAKLERANLECTDFTDSLLRNAQLQGARMACTILKGADLTGANLDGTDLRGFYDEEQMTQVEGADLREVRGLTQEQLKTALIDETTLLPGYLRRGENGEIEYANEDN